MTRPVDLIASNLLHAIAERIEEVEMRGGPVTAPALAGLTDELARNLACQIAHGARLDVVERMLEAAGICGGAAGVAQRLAAVRESRAEEGRKPAPSSAPPDGRVSGFAVGPIPSKD